MRLKFEQVPFSSTVGASISVTDADTGENVALLAVMVPNTNRDYRETAEIVSKAIIERAPDE